MKTHTVTLEKQTLQSQITRPLSIPCRIVGLGSYVPQKVLSNADLEKLVETSDEWITTRTGIKERRIASANESTSDLATNAARRALAAAKIRPEELDLIIVATVTPDMLFPSTACLVQDRLGARQAAAFDIEAACSGFIYGLEIGRQFIASGTYRKVLVIGAEKLSSIVNWKDRNTCVLFGDGAGAAVLVPHEEAGRIWTVCLGADGSKGSLLYVPAGGSRTPATKETVEQALHFIHMNGRETFKYAVQAMYGAAKAVLEKSRIEIDQVKCIIPHQANRRIIDAVVTRLGAKPDQVFVNLDKYGNTSAASVAIAFDEAVREGVIEEGDLVLLVAFGAGFTWGAALIEL